MHEPSRRRMLLCAIALVAGALAAHRALSEEPVPTERAQQLADNATPATPALRPSR
jgi:hypothetical protein